MELGFGHASTAKADSYPRQLCSAYAACIFRDVQERVLAESARDRVVAIDQGRVKRHVDRGITAKSSREGRDAEDVASRAGARESGMIVHASAQTHCGAGASVLPLCVEYR